LSQRGGVAQHVHGAVHLVDVQVHDVQLRHVREAAREVARQLLYRSMYVKSDIDNARRTDKINFSVSHVCC
jgi:2-phospho-L-lactate guanylyltransferase (CobY/MobA/RfbA family)